MKTRGHLLRLTVAALAVLAVLVMASGGAGGLPGPAESQTVAEAAKKWGIEVLGIHRSAGGYMLDFRYRILDPEKAKALLEPSVAPYLIDHKSGATLMTPAPPKVGPLRAVSKNQLPREGKSYFILFANPGRLVPAGAEVSVVVGACTLADLTVT